ncbi:MAG: polysaccharide biosynthesis protein [Nitrospira sp.]|nr:MAG: polysaccharide biosynthesis protein CapD [Nitrospira sp. OLB3]MCK6493957.1 polysaccharide biosynthesis protein [Nitrospira sp.]
MLALFGRPLTTGQRRFLLFVTHLGLAALSNWLAFVLRFDEDIPAEQWNLLVTWLPWLLVIRALAFYRFRLYDGLWRYTSLWDIRNLVLGIAASTAVFAGVVRFGLGIAAYPASVFVVDALVLLCLQTGMRVAPRVMREFPWIGKGRNRVLVVGAGDAGAMIVREMRNSPSYGYCPIGFIDDNPAKIGHHIHGVPVLGTRADLPRILAEEEPTSVLVAIPSAAPATVRAVVQALEPFRLPIQTLPNLRDLLRCHVEVSQIRNLSIEDLLDRAPVDLDPEPLQQSVQGQRVLVTGAGGSIGAELCRQVARLSPSVLVLLDRYENGLFAVARELRAAGHDVVVPVVGDITDMGQMSWLFAEYGPTLVFHAAAHKHVSLMEVNPCEAVRNNVTGTRIVAEAAHRHGVERFILISTDKAVNPVSVMGASKAVAELLLQELSRSSQTIFASVRFGNVLGSNGSALPLFLEQIRVGGPVTITDPGMRRYFMLIGEAVHLVLHAARLARGGEVFVLDMGEQISVVDMARNLIRLSGFVPDREIALTFLGRRPGEKLVEELVGQAERLEATAVPKVLCVRLARAPDASLLPALLARLEQAAAEGTVADLLATLCHILPSYHPSDSASGRHGLPAGSGNQPDSTGESAAPRMLAAGLSPTGSPGQG